MTLQLAFVQPRLAAGRPSATKSHRSVVKVEAKKAGSGKRRLDSTGYIVDNSERGNIFAVEPRQLYTSSPRADRAARQGLGGFQGLLVLGGVCGVIAVATLGLASSPADTLQGVASSGDALDSLTAIAGRLGGGL
jgi:hypothetical protein